MIKFLYELYRARKMSAAANESIGGEECVACSSRDLDVIGPDAYLCRKCGYEGGQGIARQRDERRLQAIAAMDPTARRESAKADLIESRRLLAAGITELEGAHRESAYDIVGLNIGEGYADMEGSAKFGRYSTGLGYFNEARARAMDAEAKLGMQLGAAGIDTGGSGHASQALDMHLDHFVFDIMTHGQIGASIDTAMSLARLVDHALATQFAVPPEPYR